jgi:predicted phosphodiesterase
MSKRVLILPDIQAPLEDRRAVAAVIRFLGEYQPDELVQIGDLADFPKPSRWSKGSAAEFEGNIFEDAEYIKKRILDPIRAVYEGPFKFIEGNHDERPRVHLEQYAPALSGTKAFHIDNMLDFAGYGIEWAPDFYDFAPGWTMTHGHRGGIRLTQEAGKTALGAAQKFGKSVIMGHTHRLGAQPKSFGYDGRVKTLWGVEVGNLMNMRAAQYLKGGSANWQQGFVLLTVDGSYVQPTTIPIINSRFTVDGVTFRL